MCQSYQMLKTSCRKCGMLHFALTPHHIRQLTKLVSRESSVSSVSWGEICVSTVGIVGVCLHMCYISQWKQVKQIKVEQLSDKAGRCSQYQYIVKFLQSHIQSETSVTFELQYAHVEVNCCKQLLYATHVAGSSYVGGPKQDLISLYQTIALYGPTTT